MRLEEIPEDQVVAYATVNRELAVRLAVAHPEKATDIASKMPRLAEAIARSVPLATAVKIAHRLHEPVRPKIIRILIARNSLDDAVKVILGMGNLILEGIRCVPPGEVRNEIVRRVYPSLTEKWYKGQLAKSFPEAFRVQASPTA